MPRPKLWTARETQVPYSRRWAFSVAPSVWSLKTTRRVRLSWFRVSRFLTGPAFGFENGRSQLVAIERKDAYFKSTFFDCARAAAFANDFD